MDDKERKSLSVIVSSFVRGDATRSERYFYRDELDAIPEGRAVRVTFEFVDEAEPCDGGGKA